MREIKKVDLDDEKQFAIVFRYIDRYDKLMDAIAFRSTSVVSANAILLTATALFAKEIPNLNLDVSALRFFQVDIVAIICSALISINYAITGIANMWSSTDKFFQGSGDRFVVHPGKTIDITPNFEKFKEKITSEDYPQHLEHATALLWTLINMQFLRYEKLRTAIRILIFELVLFISLVAVFVVSVRSPTSH